MNTSEGRSVPRRVLTSGLMATACVLGTFLGEYHWAYFILLIAIVA